MSIRRMGVGALALVTSVAIVVLGAVPAAAGGIGGGGKPIREFAPSGLPFTFGEGIACNFSVTIFEVENNEFAKTFPNGNVLITGRLVVRIQNDATLQSVVRNVSGPLSVTDSGHVVTLTGVSISPVFAGHDETGQIGTGMFIFHGPTIFVDTQLTQVSGTVENLCETLAS